MDIAFKTGVFQHFIARRKFTLGDSGVTVGAGRDIHFDGVTVQYEGTEVVFPKLRGSVTMGWIVPAADYLSDTSAPAPQSAGVQVRHATNGGNPMSPAPRTSMPITESDERIVVNSNERASNVEKRNIASRTASVNPARLAGQKVRTAGGYEIMAEAQDGVPVRSLKSPAKSVTDMSDASEEMSAAKNLTFTPTTGNPQSMEERVANMSEEDRLDFEAKRAGNKAEAEAAERKAGKPASRPVVVKSIPKRDGVIVAKGSTEIEDLSDSMGTATVTTTEVDGIKITNTNGPGTFRKKAGATLAADKAAPLHVPMMSDAPSKIEKDGTAAARRHIAKSICAEFPDTYDFADHWKKRLARIRLDFETRPEIIKAIFAAESDEFKVVLVEEFPEVFNAA